jgi:hypothetical protein
MKKSLILATVALALGYAVVLIAGYTSFKLVSFTALFGSVFSLGLLLTAFSDYSRKPRFLARHTRQATHEATTATSSAIDPASVWTYNTISA